MTHKFDHNASRRPRTAPLPDGFSAEDRSIDERLSSMARASVGGTPVGLSDRVFEASAGLLPSSAGFEKSARRLRLVGGPASAAPRLVWGRFAVAASVLLACGVGFWFMKSPSPQPRTSELAVVDQDPEIAIAAAFGPLPASSTEPMEQMFATLLDTNALTSPEDFFGDLASFGRKLKG